MEYVNATLAAMIGYSQDEVIGEPLRDVVAPGNLRRRCRPHAQADPRRGGEHALHHQAAAPGRSPGRRRGARFAHRLQGAPGDHRRVDRHHRAHGAGPGDPPLARAAAPARRLHQRRARGAACEIRPGAARRGRRHADVHQDGCDRIRRRVESPDLAEICDTLIELTKETIDTVRKMSEDLRPSVLDHLGLAAAISRHLDQFAARHGITGSFDAGRDEVELPQARPSRPTDLPGGADQRRPPRERDSSAWSSPPGTGGSR